MSEKPKETMNQEAGIPAEEIEAPSGGAALANPWPEETEVPGGSVSVAYPEAVGRVVTRPEANAEAIATMRIDVDEHDRALVRLVRKVSDIDAGVTKRVLAAETRHDELVRRFGDELEELVVARSAHTDEESVQILYLRGRLERLDEIVEAIRGSKRTQLVDIPITLAETHRAIGELRGGSSEPTERESDLERALGMRNHENRQLAIELDAVRETRKRAVSESGRRGVRIEELENNLQLQTEQIKVLGSALTASDSELKERNEEIIELREVLSRQRRREELELEVKKLRGLLGEANARAERQDARIANLQTHVRTTESDGIDDLDKLRESIRRKDAQNAGLVAELKAVREELDGTSMARICALEELAQLEATLEKAATFAHSAEAVIARVLEAAEISDGGVYVRDAETRKKLIDEIDLAFRVASNRSIAGAAKSFAVLRWSRSTSERPDVSRFGTDVEAAANFEGSLKEAGASQLVAVLRQSAQDFPTVAPRYPEWFKNAFSEVGPNPAAVVVLESEVDLGPRDGTESHVGVEEFDDPAKAQERLDELERFQENGGPDRVTLAMVVRRFPR